MHGIESSEQLSYWEVSFQMVENLSSLAQKGIQSKQKKKDP